tara:strand:+ start:16417 stop:16959 length:543 start_codon:yes stop_codon:yes gene_type:complete
VENKHDITVKELINLGSATVRRDNDLMRAYIVFYEHAFFIKPNCVPCTFDRDYNRLRNHILTGGEMTAITTNFTMGKYILNKRFSSQILTYKIGNRPHRCYGHLITDQFAEEFLKNGTKKQLTERKEMFDMIPPPPPPPAEQTYKTMNRAQLNELLKADGLDPNDFSTKREIIAFYDERN